MLCRSVLRRFTTVDTTRAAANTVAAPVQAAANKSTSVLSRLRAFASGAVFASAVGMYVISFQLQGLLDEMRSAVHDVSMRQTMIESKLAKIAANHSASAEHSSNDQ